MKNVQSLWRYSAGYRHCFFLLFLSVFVAAYLEIRIPHIMSEVLDGAYMSLPISDLARLCGRIGILSIILVAEGIVEGYFSSRWSAGVTRNLADALFDRILSFESWSMDRFGSATALTRLTTDITTLRHALNMIGSLLLCPLLVVLTAAVAFQVHFGLSMIFILVIPLFGGLLFFIIWRSRAHYRKMLAEYDDMNQTLSETFQGMRTVKSFAAETERKTVFYRITNALRNENQAAERLAALNNPLSKMMVNLSILALTWLGGKNIIGGSLSVGSLFCLITYTNQILAQMLIISMILVPMITSQVSLERIREMLEYEDGPRRGGQEGNAHTAADDAMAVPPEISFENVSFSYGGDSSDPLLCDLNFKIHSGEFFGIIGPGGSGKTTLARLLMGLYSPDQGTVKIGSRNCLDFPYAALRSLFGYVPQKAGLFAGTIRENLSGGKEISEEAILENACRTACISEFIESQPERYEYLLQEGGGNLSGGQRQRLCLARGLAGNAPILVLDNMTSAVDRVTEERICRNLREGYSGTTRIVISDRISTIRDAQRILVLDRGRIAGLGTHEQLLEECPLYAEIADTQKRSVGDV